MKKTKKLISIIITSSIILTALCSMSLPAQALSRASVTEGTYVFYSKLGGDMVMDVDNASTKSGANVQLWKYNGSTAQQFEVKKSGDWYIIKPVCSGLALDVQGGSKESGANVQQYTPNNTDSQKWQFYDAGNGYFYLRSKVGNKALDVRGGKKINGTNIQVYNPGNNNDAQQWKLKNVSDSSKNDSNGYTQKVNKFLSDSRWKNGATWKASQKPKISNYSAYGCCAYAVDFCKYVFDKNSYTAGRKFTNPNDIKAGDVIKVTNSQHWFVVIDRNGNKLKTAEGNWGGKVVVSNGTYTINGNKLYRSGKPFRTFSAGYHMQ